MKFQCAKCRRSGTITLLLAFVLMLAVMATLAVATRNEVATRRSQMERASISQLEAAIDSVALASFEMPSSIRLPIDSSIDHWIEVQVIDPAEAPETPNTEQTTESLWFKATELRGERTLRSIERRINKATK